MGRGVAFLLGAVFGSVGVVFLAMMANGVWTWFDSGSWQRVPAKVTMLKLKTSPGDATTYRVDCAYSYKFAGRAFTGDTASLYQISDNIGSFQQDLYARLEADQQAAKSTCLVDPDHPERSLLDRTFRPGMLGLELVFVIAFGSVGLSILAFAVGSRADREVDGRMKTHSRNCASRFAAKVMCLYHALVAGLAMPISLISLLSGSLLALLPLALSALSAATVYYCFRYFARLQPVTGKLLLPRPAARQTDSATLLLPARWQGPVELETRWTIPVPPSNRVGVEDETGDADHVSLPAVGGTTRQTEIELPLPELPDKPMKDQPIKLEIVGTIGGVRFYDEFELTGKSLNRLYAAANDQPRR